MFDEIVNGMIGELKRLQNVATGHIDTMIFTLKQRKKEFEALKAQKRAEYDGKLSKAKEEQQRCSMHERNFVEASRVIRIVKASLGLTSKWYPLEWEVKIAKMGDNFFGGNYLERADAALETLSKLKCANPESMQAIEKAKAELDWEGPGLRERINEAECAIDHAQQDKEVIKLE